jgi:hypothetical protein
MKKLSVIFLILCVGVSASGAFARGGGMGSNHSSVTGGAFGTSPAAPGTNSLGTALSSSGTGSPTKGPLLGTNPAIDREEARLDKVIGSICRGC